LRRPSHHIKAVAELIAELPNSYDKTRNRSSGCLLGASSKATIDLEHSEALLPGPNALHNIMQKSSVSRRKEK
jgi:hypothetical protein